MSRQIIDNDLVSWEVTSSTGRFSLPDAASIVFVCLTHPERRPRTVRLQGDTVEAEATLANAGDQRLRELLAASRELA
jgi:hypothetical protein